ncbi:MAG: flagellar basal body rod protein FlgC [Chloroflexi bacterium]|nr:flagellar basal body rod protein FlgC [Chloroflexota bacterium]
MGYLSSLQISASGLTAQRLRMDVISNNLANMETTRTARGGPYLREQVVFSSRASTGARGILANSLQGPSQQAGVRAISIVEDQNAVRRVYDPTHPDAGPDGYVTYPDINVVTEMTDMISASRAYEANITALNVAKDMAVKTLDLFR